MAVTETERTMDVRLKIWRYDSRTGERNLEEFEVEAPEWACFLDVLDLIKDKHDGTLAYRKSCRMMICGSCGMRMDGRAVLACKERMAPIVEAGHVPVISAMGNLLIVTTSSSTWLPSGKIRAVKPWLDPGYGEIQEKERIASQQQMNAIAKESLCIMCGCCVSECNSMESDPAFLGRRRWPRASASSATPARAPRSSGSWSSTASTGSGTARAATSATSAARRASTRATRSPSSAPSRSSRGSNTTWAPSTRTGSSPRRRRPAGYARPSLSPRRRGSCPRSSRRDSRSAWRRRAASRRRSRRTWRTRSRRRAASGTSSGRAESGCRRDHPDGARACPDRARGGARRAA